MSFKCLNIKLWLIAAIGIPALVASGQPVGDTIPEPQNQLTVDLQFLARGESRYGGLPTVEISNTEEDDKVPKSNFLLGRTRLPINFKRGWLEARVSPEYAGVWGQSGGGDFDLYEAWVKMNTHFGMFAQVGHVALSYDDKRIIGSDDWSMTPLTHDVLRLGYEGHGHKAHVILAYNQNAKVINNGGSIYEDGSLPYKTMQTLWYHYGLSHFPLGASALFMNIGMQSTVADNKDRTWFQHLAGGYLSFQPSHWKAEASYYNQFGKNEQGFKIQAWMTSAKVTYLPTSKFHVTAGYDYLSGDKYFAVPPGNQFGLVRHDVIRGFNSVYGSHHKFYGAMEFFYVSAYHDGFSPGLQNAYIGCAYSPLKGLMLNADYHYYATATELEDLKKTLGHEIEFQASYALAADVRISAGTSIMWGGETMARLKRSHDENLRWGYITLIVNPRILTTKW